MLGTYSCLQGYNMTSALWSKQIVQESSSAVCLPNSSSLIRLINIINVNVVHIFLISFFTLVR